MRFPPDTETLAACVVTLFMLPFSPYQLGAHFVVSSDVPLNSSSKTKLHVPETPTGTTEEGVGVEVGVGG